MSILVKSYETISESHALFYVFKGVAFLLSVFLIIKYIPELVFLFANLLIICWVFMKLWQFKNNDYSFLENLLLIIKNNFSLFRNDFYVERMFDEEVVEKRKLPLTTYVLLGVFLVAYPVFKDQTNLPAALALIVNPFVHLNFDHLLETLVFVEVIGEELEEQIGAKAFLVYFIAAAIMSNLFDMMFQGGLQERALYGASGAVAGILGVFLVRNYFKTVVFPVPVMGQVLRFTPLKFKLKLNAILFVAVFFFLYVNQFFNVKEIAYLINLHIIMILFFAIVAVFMRYYEDAENEFYLRMGIDSVDRSIVTIGEGEKALKKILKRVPNHPVAMLYLARIHSKFSSTREGEEYYIKSIRAFYDDNFERACKIYKEYFDSYFRIGDPYLTMRMVPVLCEHGYAFVACNSLELLLKENKFSSRQLEEKAHYYYANVVGVMGNRDAAKHLYEKFLVAFPKSDYSDKIRKKFASYKRI